MKRTICSVLLLGTTAAGTALALPPAIAPAYTATYKHTMKSPDDTTNDTTTISVSKGHSRWERQSDKLVTIVDRGAKTTTAFGGSVPAKEAAESPLPQTASWEFGYGTIAADSKPPEEKGTDTVAGQRCTDLQFDSEQFGKPKLCVTEQGVVARFFLDDPDDSSVTTFEAEKITVGDPPASAFKVPEGLTVERR